MTNKKEDDLEIISTGVLFKPCINPTCGNPRVAFNDVDNCFRCGLCRCAWRYKK